MNINDITPAAVTRARVEVSLGADVIERRVARSATDPAASTTYYHIPSRDGRGLHEVTVTATRDGISLQCDCRAGVAGRACWHLGAAVLVLDGECPVRVTAAVAAGPRVSARELSGQPDAA